MAKTKRPTLELPLLELSDEQQRIVLDSIQEFRGHANTLETALGALIIGRHMGWRVLRMVHSPATYKKYEKCLGLKFQDVCPERTEHSSRCTGIKAADKLNAFWDVVMGRQKVENKGGITE